MSRVIAPSVALLSLALAGCSAQPATPEAAPTVTVTVEAPVADPAPTVTVTVTAEAVGPVEAAPDPAEGVLFEALGEGTATVHYTSGGGMVSNDVSLPFSVELEPSSLGLVGVVNGTGAVGCRLSSGDAVIAETPLVEGQFYAECTD